MPQLFSSFRLNVSHLSVAIRYPLHGPYNIYTILKIHF